MEILEVSHLIVVTRYITEATNFFEAQGYSQVGEVETLNPPEKADFVAGTLAPACLMKLLVPKDGTTAVELLTGDGQGMGKSPTAQPNFEAVLASEKEPKVSEILSSRPAEDPDLLPGFRHTGLNSQHSGIAALLVHCHDTESASSLWGSLGFQIARIAKGIAKLRIPGIMTHKGLTVYFVEDRTSSRMGYLNDEGVVCLSLLCRDADRLRSRLSAEGYFVSRCFTFRPFGWSLRVFFSRNKSGETYEFLSVMAPGSVI